MLDEDVVGMGESSDRGSRIAIALPPLDQRGRVLAERQGWDIDLLDPEDPDARAVLIRLAHPDLAEAIDGGLDEVRLGGDPVNPRLHLAMHEVVATQIIEDDPPAVHATADRLLRMGRDPHEVLHMLGITVSNRIWEAMHGHSAPSIDEHVRALDALPGSWDALAPPVGRAERRAAARGRPRPRRR